MIIIFIILFLNTALLASLEMSISSVNRLRIKSAAQTNKKYEKALYVLDNYDETLTTIIVLNNIINIILPIIATLISQRIFDAEYAYVGLFFSTVLLTILLLMFGEILPKLYGKKNPERMLRTFSGLIIFIVKIFKPITFVFISTNNFFRDRFFKNSDEKPEVEEEILTMIEESAEEGTIEENEGLLIRNAIEFSEIRVDEILQPKNNMVMVDVELSNEEIYDLIMNDRYSRIPVYQDTTDNIIGLIYERDFLREFVEKKSFDLHKIIREVEFVPDTLKISKLLPQMQKQHNNMVIIVDEYGTVQGLITVEDIIEELVGEIWDEHDEVVTNYIKLANGAYQVRGNIMIDDFNELFDAPDIDTETEDSTIAGYLLEKAERIPSVGDVIADDIYEFKIVEMDGQKIEKVIVNLLSQTEESESEDV